MIDMGVRKQVLALLKSGKTVEEVSHFLKISMRTIFRWKSREKEGRLEPDTHRSRMVKINVTQLQEYVRENPDKTLKEMAIHHHVSIHTIWRRLKQLGITLKKRPSYIKNGMNSNETSFGKR